MAYDTKELEKKAIEAIDKHNLFFIEDVVAYLPCSKTTFYAKGLHESNELMEKLETNRMHTKNALRKKWFASDNATLQMALMKIIASNEERQKLSQTYVDHTSGGDKLNVALVEFIDEKDQDSDSE